MIRGWMRTAVAWARGLDSSHILGKSLELSGPQRPEALSSRSLEQCRYPRSQALPMPAPPGEAPPPLSSQTPAIHAVPGQSAGTRMQEPGYQNA